MSQKIYVETPEEFKDSDWGEQVYGTATRLFTAVDAPTVFAQASEWIALHKIYVLNVSWDHMADEERPYCLTVYFTFDDSYLD